MDLGQVAGSSAYQTAVEAGYTDTETAFNATLFNVPKRAAKVK